MAAKSEPQIFVVGADLKPVTDGRFAFHQDAVVDEGPLAKDGRAQPTRIDLNRPFTFEIKDRVCAIRAGAFLNPDDARIEYGGTWFDWTLVRDGQNPEKRFWPFYQKEMDTEPRAGVDAFMQHEHVTRRPIQLTKPVLLQHGKVTIRATPLRIRVGPMVRYTDHERAVIWLETVTPAMVRIRYVKTGVASESSAYGTTVRVGGRYFAAVEIEGLAEDTFYNYTVELAPMGAAAIPQNAAEVQKAFPALTTAVRASIESQCQAVSLTANPWLAFRTLRRRFDKQMRFAFGSCRWYPGDVDAAGKNQGPDMLLGLGNWLRNTQRDRWPRFLFFGGDQIYSDEIGLSHGKKLAISRFAARVPGPADPHALRDKLVDGAWSGRFAHRFQAFTAPAAKWTNTVRDGLKTLDGLRKAHPDIGEIYKHHPDLDRRKALETRHATLKTRRKDVQGAKMNEAGDERQARLAVEALAKIEPLEISSEPFRAIWMHCDLAAQAAWRNPMATGFLAQNFALWSIPNFEAALPTVKTSAGWTLARQAKGYAHPPAERGLHAADFAEYAYLYQRAWTSAAPVRSLLAHVPTFLMFDDHEVTDDWNFDAEWVRMLHNPGDELKMWPKTLTDALAAYWVYQGWGNKAPSQWPASDPRAAALNDARKAGTDALPQLRRVIYQACWSQVPAKNAPTFQTGLSLDWHYRLPFDPPFLVPDCRSRRLMVAADDQLRVIDHDDAKKTPKSQTIDDRQLAWMRGILVDQYRGGRVAFIAPSTPLLMKKKFMTFMREPEVAAGAWARGSDVAGIFAVLFDSKFWGTATGAMLRVFRRGKDLEHMIRDRSWRDLWALVEDMRKKGSAVQSLVLVSGDVHHSYCMTANPSRSGRARPEVVQLTCSGLQTTIRGDVKSWLAEQLSSLPFDIGARRMVPGFTLKDGKGRPDLVLFENAAAVVDVTMGMETDVTVTYLTRSAEFKGQVQHVYRYTSAPGYLKSSGETAVAL